MSVELTLLPFDGDRPQNGLAFSHTMIPWGCPGNEATGAGPDNLNREVKYSGAQPVPPCFNSYRGRNADGEPAYGQTVEDCYGRPVLCVAAGRLAAILYRYGDWPRARAALAYLRELPHDTRVALYWH